MPFKYIYILLFFLLLFPAFSEEKLVFADSKTSEIEKILPIVPHLSVVLSENIDLDTLLESNCEEYEKKRLYSSLDGQNWKEENLYLSFIDTDKGCVLSFKTNRISYFALGNKKGKVRNLEIKNRDDGTKEISGARVSFADDERKVYPALDFKKILSNSTEDISEEEIAEIKTVTIDGGITLENTQSHSTVVFPAKQTTISSISGKWDGKINPPIVQINDEEGLIIKIGNNSSILDFGSDTSVQPVINIYLSDTTCDPQGYSVERKSFGDENFSHKGLSNISFSQFDGDCIVSFSSRYMSEFSVHSSNEVEKIPADIPAEQAIKNSDDTQITTENFFLDVQTDHWAKDYIQILSDKGIIKGKAKEKFIPEGEITRAEFLKIVLLSIVDIEEVGKCSQKVFSDVNTDDWYFYYICTAKKLRLIKGYEGGGFNPNTPISRAEALKILLAAKEGTVSFDINYTFPDVSREDWFAPYISYAKKHNIISGREDGNFYPYAKLLRAEAAKIVVKGLNVN